MNAHQYLYALHQKNPQVFKAEEIKMTVASLEAQIIAAYEAGERGGIEKAKLKDQRSLFDIIFGAFK